MTITTLDTLRQHSAYTLADMADVSAPDGPDSPGATFLTGVRDDVIESFTGAMIDTDSIHDAIAAMRDDTVHEIADGAPSVYTHTMMQQLLDLGAYHEDVSELASDSDAFTIERLAAAALCIVAERLVNALLDEIDAS